MNILFEDNYILVCEKPAGIATQAAKVTEKDMVSEVNNYIRKAGGKSPAYLIHRLDKPVRGVLVFAKTKESAAELNRQLTSTTSDKGFSKMYHAYVEGIFDSDDESRLLQNYIYKDGDRAVIVDSEDAEAKKDKIKDSKGRPADIKIAKLEYKVESNNPADMTKLDIKLITGRFHQIRCQLSYIGHPIIGDALYGSKKPYKKRNAIGLVAYSISFNHPTTHERMEFELEEG